MEKDEIKALVEVDGSGCWLWLGTVHSAGYAVRGNRYVHRIAYEAFVGPIPEKYQIDHLCRVRLCVNPAHLEAVTQRENILRGVGACSDHARKTTCVNGHEFDGVRRTPSGTGRTCSTCLKARRRKTVS